jgi:oxygen-independent coproporphyrinogen-3 oxidase
MNSESPQSAGPHPGVYVHVPFCGKLCPYCVFPVAVGRDQDQEAYVEAVMTEARARGPELERPAGALNFGGGTPSRIQGGSFKFLVSGLREILPLVSGAEISLEANPEDVTPEKAEGWAEAGVTRVSLGAQSFEPAGLLNLGRLHGPETAAHAVALLRRAGVPNLNLDLIAGEPSGSWFFSLSQALALEVPHVSFYILEYEPGTALSRDRTRTRWTAGQEGETLLAAAEWLQSRGYEWYEVSNFARPGFRCRYNDNFWKGGGVLGLGPGAASSLGPVRRRNARSLSRYLKAPLDPGELEILSSWQRLSERVLMGLRTLEGLALGNSALEERVLRAAEEPSYAGLLRVEGRRIRPLPEGRLLADGLACDLMPPRQEGYSHSDEPVLAR